MTVAAHRSTTPALSIVASALIWGAWWIPLRTLENHGLSGSWATVWVYGIGFAMLTPMLLVRRRRVFAGLGMFTLVALFSGTSLAAWNHALLTGEVVRSMLLFFVSPVWATLLAWVVLKQPMARLRLVSVPLGLLGAAVVLGADVGTLVPRSEGEVAALIAGLLFAVASVVIRAATEVGDWEKTAATFLGCAAGAVLAAMARPVGEAPAWPIVVAVLPLVIAVAVVVLLPATWLEVWGNSRLDPGAVNVIFQIEIVIAALTASWLTSEPFGWREAIGGGLIVGASMIETLGQRWPRTT
ncbi:MAG: DMT family transporter [Alphaproteobacteria bacterium]|nr:DMT family transporter [Alphaproteobacteria bacterium]